MCESQAPNWQKSNSCTDQRIAYFNRVSTPENGLSLDKKFLKMLAILNIIEHRGKMAWSTYSSSSSGITKLAHKNCRTDVDG